MRNFRKRLRWAGHVAFIGEKEIETWLRPQNNIKMRAGSQGPDRDRSSPSHLSFDEKARWACPAQLRPPFPEGWCRSGRYALVRTLRRTGNFDVCDEFDVSIRGGSPSVQPAQPEHHIAEPKTNPGKQQKWKEPAFPNKTATCKEKRIKTR
jgi:hypothetical protein